MKKLSTLLLTSLAFSSSLLSATLDEEITNSSLVVYNSNLGLVHEQRALSLNTADTSIIYEGVAQSIKSDSISAEISPNVILYSQQYRYDALSQQKLLQAHIGKKVEVRLLKNRNEFKIITATLLSSNAKKSLVRTLAYKIITVNNDDVIFESIPDRLVTKPSLLFNIKTLKDTKTQMKLDYLISNISFTSNYVLNIDGNNANLTGWVSIDNKSGKRFEQTKLSLVAGDIQIQQNNHPQLYKSMQVMSDAPRVKEDAFEGYHFYTIGFPVTLANNETTQIQFMQKKNIAMQKLYSATLTNPLYFRGEKTSKASQFIHLKGLDTPLPQGKIRIYSKQNGQSILLGESSIEQTAKNSNIALKNGINFDVKVTQKVTARKDTKSFFNVDVEYAITNSSDANKTVTLLVPFNTYEDSKVTTDENYTFTKGNLVTFSVAVDANSVKKFNVNYESKK